MAVVDLDHFKRFNDEHGHQAGDELLAGVARAWRPILRADDRLVRYGGEEFALLLPNTDVAAAHAIADRLRSLVPGEATCSVGLAQWRTGEDAHELFARADGALYAAKRAGRDRIVLAA